MSSDSETTNANSIVIQPAEAEDRAALALLVPDNRHLVETCWALVALQGEPQDRTIVGAVMLTNRYVAAEQAALGIRLSMMPTWLETDLPDRLLEPALAAATEWGAKRLRLLQHVPVDGERAALFKRLGFSEADTFDAFQLDLKEAVDGWRYAQGLLERTFKGTVQYEIAKLEEQYARPVASAWSKWIGGQMEEHVDSIIRGIAGLPSQVDPRFSRIVLHDGKVAGLAICRVKGKALHVDALAIAPQSRMSGVQTRMLLDIAVPALEAGAETQYFEAGRSQPDTQRVAKRLGATLIASRVAFERDLPTLA